MTAWLSPPEHWVRSYTIGADHVPLPCFDLLEWARWHQANEQACRVGDDCGAHYRVSTVFLALDLNWREAGDPVLFETMVFFDDGELGVMERYCSWATAAAGHERIRAMLARESADAEQITLATLHKLLDAPPQPTSRNAREGWYHGKHVGRHVRGPR